MHTGRTTEADEIRLLSYSTEWTPCDVAEVKRMGPAPPNQQPILVAGRDVGRNQPCPGGSGRKYKRCCMRKGQA